MSKADPGIRAQLFWLQSDHLRALRQLKAVSRNWHEAIEVGGLLASAVMSVLQRPDDEEVAEWARGTLEAWTQLLERFAEEDLTT